MKNSYQLWVAAHLLSGVIVHGAPIVQQTIYLPIPIYVNGCGPTASSSAAPDPTSSSSAAASSSTASSSAAPSVLPSTAANSSDTIDPPSFSGSEGNGTINGTTGLKNAVYFTNWGIYSTNYQPQQLPVSQLSHILYAFADIGADGTVKSSDTYADLEKHYPTDSWNDTGGTQNAYGVVKQLYILKKQNRGLKTLLSIGGWTYSPKFAPVAATESGIQTFASSAVKLLADWGFDGLDIDWEYPKDATEAQNFVALLKACREALDDYSKQIGSQYRFQLTVAAPAGPQNYQKLDVKGMDQYLDAWHLMTYDYAGSWDNTSGHQANIYKDPSNPTATKFNTDQALKYYLGQGIASTKIVLGLPLYGRAFEDTAGPGQSYNGVGPGGKGEQGVWPYNMLPRQGATEHWDDTAKAAWSYDASTREMISYDDGKSLAAKSTYLRNEKLGGAFFWEASGDKNGTESLIGSMAKSLGGLDTSSNNLKYPTSQYGNIRQGMA